MGRQAEVTPSADGGDLARVQMPCTVLFAAGNGETLDIGRDLGVTVTEYRTSQGRIEGYFPHITIDFS